jgi:cyclopropane fatty-acyl-phospholipid synthase-like methyltransferase
MNQAYFRIKDHCSAKLLPFLEQALDSVHLPAKPQILDIGCGTGVPTLFLAGRYHGIIVAVDPDALALEWLEPESPGTETERETYHYFGKVGRT